MRTPQMRPVLVPTTTMSLYAAGEPTIGEPSEIVEIVEPVKPSIRRSVPFSSPWKM